MTIETHIKQILRTKLILSKLEITNESYKHKGHPGSADTGDTHFRLVLVSDHFKGLTRIQRHQLVYSCLADLMNNPIHALSLQTSTPEEDSLS